MTNKQYRQTAGGFSYDDYTVVFRASNGKDTELGGVEIDFDNKKIVLKKKDKE